MPSEQDLVITAFLREADEPEGVSTLEAQRYWHLAGNELGRIISSLGGTPLSATAGGEPALLCLGEHGAAIITIRGNSFVVHRVRRILGGGASDGHGEHRWSTAAVPCTRVDSGLLHSRPAVKRLPLCVCNHSRDRAHAR